MSKIGFIPSKEDEVIIRQKENTIYSFDSGYTLSQEDAKLHTLILGTTGTGKTASVFLPMLYGQMCTGECGLIVDIKGNLRGQVRSLAKACDRDKDIFEFGLSETAIPCNIIEDMTSNEFYNFLELLVDNSMERKTGNKDFHVRGIMQCVKIYDFLCLYAKMKNEMSPTLKDVYFYLVNLNKAAQLYTEYKEIYLEKTAIEDFSLFEEIEADAFSLFHYSTPSKDKDRYYQQLDYAISGPRTALAEILSVKNFERNFAAKGAPGINIRNNFYKTRIVILRFAPGSGKIGASLSRYFITKYYETVFDMQPQNIIDYPSFICIDEFHEVATLNNKTRFADTAFVAQAREFRASFIASTQSASSLMCNNNDEESVKAFIANCNTRIYFRTDDPRTQALVNPYNSNMQLLDLEDRNVYLTSYSNTDRKLIVKLDTVNNSYQKVQAILNNEEYVIYEEEILKTNNILLKILQREQILNRIEKERLKKVELEKTKEIKPYIKIYDIENMMGCKILIESFLEEYKHFFVSHDTKTTYVPIDWQEAIKNAFKEFSELGNEISIQNIIHDTVFNCIKVIALEEIYEDENAKAKEMQRLLNSLITKHFKLASEKAEGDITWIL